MLGSEKQPCKQVGRVHTSGPLWVARRAQAHGDTVTSAHRRQPPGCTRGTLGCALKPGLKPPSPSLAEHAAEAALLPSGASCTRELGCAGERSPRGLSVAPAFLPDLSILRVEGWALRVPGSPRPGVVLTHGPFWKLPQVGGLVKAVSKLRSAAATSQALAS